MATDIITQYFFMEDEPDRGWAVKFLPHIPFTFLTRLDIAFLVIEDGRLVAGDASANPTNQQRITLLADACRAVNSTAEIFVTTGNGTAMYRRAAQNPLAFGQSVVDFLIANNFHGYDIDWEEDVDPEVLQALLLGVRYAMNQSGRKLRLTVAVWPDPAQPVKYDIQGLAGTVDQINLMSYGANQPLDIMVGAWVEAGFPIDRIIAGVGTEAGDYQDTLGPDGSIVHKVRFAQQRGLPGMMAWRLDNDYTDPKTKFSTYQGAKQLYDAVRSR